MELNMEQQQALTKASQYLAHTAFSAKGLMNQLIYEGFSRETASFIAFNIVVDWNEQATRKAQNYLDSTAFSKKGLVDQLIYEGFSRSEAMHGVTQVGY